MKLDSKIYIAGHNGLVGSTVLRQLRKLGYNNLVYANRSDLDLIDQNAVREFFELHRPEYVLLAAGKVGGIAANNTYRAQFIYENIQIQSNIIHHAHLYHVRKLLFLGSSCIYPKHAPQPIQEDALLSSELEYSNEPYAIAKIAGLKMCEAYNLQYGDNFIAAMPTNLYGYNDNFNLKTSHVLPGVLRKIHLAKCLEDQDWVAIQEDLNKRPIDGLDGRASKAAIQDVLSQHGIIPQDKGVSITLWGSGRANREFLWADDLADACIYLLKQVDFSDITAHCTGPIRNTHLNVGSGEEMSIKDMAILMKKMLGFQGKIQFEQTEFDGTPRKVNDSSKMHQLGWRHRTSLKDGLEMLYQHYTTSHISRQCQSKSHKIPSNVIE